MSAYTNSAKKHADSRLNQQSPPKGESPDLSAQKAHSPLDRFHNLNQNSTPEKTGFMQRNEENESPDGPARQPDTSAPSLCTSHRPTEIPGSAKKEKPPSNPRPHLNLKYHKRFSILIKII